MGFEDLIAWEETRREVDSIENFNKDVQNLYDKLIVKIVWTLQEKINIIMILMRLRFQKTIFLPGAHGHRVSTKTYHNCQV